jgi:hypothetical protein
VDRFGLGEPLPGHKVVQTLTTVLTDEAPQAITSVVISMGTRTACCPGSRR